MSVDAATVRRIAHLARIAVTDDEVPHLQGELNAMLAFVEQLSEVNVDGVEPMTSVTPMEMKKRADMVNDGGIADDIVRNAPASEDDNGAEVVERSWRFERSEPVRAKKMRQTKSLGRREIRCLLCDDEKAYQAIELPRRDGAAGQDRRSGQGDGRRARCARSLRQDPQAGRPGQRQDAVSVLLQPG
jgi:aspartyl-tRNA(Asn)/glutamyl-tRNA(Gln) amidotransferase subunit C